MHPNEEAAQISLPLQPRILPGALLCPYESEDPAFRRSGRLPNLRNGDQVRGNASTYYPSKLGPWSEAYGWKSPGFDPLQLAIGEAHAKGMALHAWMGWHRRVRGRIFGGWKRGGRLWCASKLWQRIIKPAVVFTLCGVHP